MELFLGIDLGIRIDEIRVLGGGSKSPVWLHTLAKILNKPIKTLRVGDAGSLGSIMLCGKALGVYPSVEKAVASLVMTDNEIHYEAPQTIYEKQYQLFLELYEKLQPSFQKAAQGRSHN